MTKQRTENEQKLINLFTAIIDHRMSYLQVFALRDMISSIERNGVTDPDELERALWEHNYGPMGGGLPADADDCSGQFDG